LSGKPEIYALYLARYDDVEVFSVSCGAIHILSLMGQKYMQIRTSSTPEGLINSIGGKHVINNQDNRIYRLSQQLHYSVKPVAQPDFVGGVADAPVERFAARVELVAVAQPDAREVELRHAGQLTGAAGVEPDAEHPFHEEQRRGFGLRPEALRIGHQHRWPELEVGPQVEQRTCREVVQVTE